MSSILVQVDFNQYNYLHNSHNADSKKLQLTLPERVRVRQEEKWRAVELSHATRPKLTFFELQRRIQELISDHSVCHAQGFNCTVTRAGAAELYAQLTNLLKSADADAQALLEQLSTRRPHSAGGATVLEPASTWSADSSPLSSKIMTVLRLKQDELRQGYEYAFDDFMDHLLLMVMLRENVSADELLHRARLLGPSTRTDVESTLCSLASGATVTSNHKLCNDGMITKVTVLPAEQLYVYLKKHVRPTLTRTSSFTNRYHAMVLDDLIEMDENAHKPEMESCWQRVKIPSLRPMLCEWLFKFTVCDQRLRLRMETYFLSIAIFDRLIAVTSLRKEQLPMYGCASLLLASKYEEIYSISPRLIVESTENKFTVAQLMETEQHIALSLNFRIATATISQLANALLVSQDPPASSKQRHLVHYIAATLTVRTYFGEYHQRVLATTAVYMSRLACSIPTGTPSAAVRKLVPRVFAALQMNSTSVNVGRHLWNIFSRPEYENVSSFVLSAASRFLLAV